MDINNFYTDDIILIRCIITAEGEDYYKGKDYQGNKYLIIKNGVLKNTTVGEDRSFYAYKKEDMGIFSGRIALLPIAHEDYLKLLGKERRGGKTLKELGVDLDSI